MKTKRLVTYAVLMALTTILTMVIQIPTPTAYGYLNLGDMVVFMAALMYGKKAGFIIGGIGSALADILLGWAVYAPITLVVKGMEGFVTGLLLETAWGKKKNYIPLFIGAAVMATGYCLAEVFLYGHSVALVNLPGNAMQSGFGAISAIILWKVIRKRINLD